MVVLQFVRDGSCLELALSWDELLVLVPVWRKEVAVEVRLSHLEMVLILIAMMSLMLMMMAIQTMILA
jgi:hypothetical protein